MRWKTRREDSESEDSGDEQPALPEGWESHKTDELHKTNEGYKKHRFYHNAVTKQSTWTRPPLQALPQALPLGWKEHTDTDGTPYYMNEFTHQSSWTRPAPTESEITITITNDSGKPAPPKGAPPAATRKDKDKPKKAAKATAQKKAVEEESSSDDDDDDDDDDKRSCVMWLCCLPFQLLHRGLSLFFAVACLPFKCCAKLPCVSPVVSAFEAAYKWTTAPFRLMYSVANKALKCVEAVLCLPFTLCRKKEKKQKGKKDKKDKKKKKKKKHGGDRE